MKRSKFTETQIVLQLEAWPFRYAKPRNQAGWMTQAIEYNYEPPASYVADKQQQQERAKVDTAQVGKRAFTICGGTGFRIVKSNQYPNCAMRQCSHDPLSEFRTKHK